MGSTSRSSSREVRIRVPFFQDVYFSRGTLPTKKGVKKGTILDELDIRNAYGCHSAPVMIPH